MYLWEHRDHLEFDVNIKGYIYNYVRTRCISYLRKRKSMLKAQSELYRKEQWRIESSINTLSNEEQIGKLFQSEIIEIYRRELAKCRLLLVMYFGKPSGRYDLPSNCGKIQPDRPAGYFGDSAGKFLASDTAKRLSGECYNYAAISTINEKEWKPSACNECQEILRRSSQPMCILPCKYALPLVRIRVEPVRTYCRRQFPDMKNGCRDIRWIVTQLHHRFHEEFSRISAASVLLIRVGIQPRNGSSADFRYVFMCSVVR